ncbi:MAG: TIGR01212 family radical SAM protein [Oscillospiraceae bacterium]|nr:TIGR01212 family radical SAM protein [Oscillospiraceae bacterium]
MKNDFVYSNSNKRYHAYEYYLNKKYNAKVAKIALDAGFSCPHLDEAGQGCIYCASKYHSKTARLLTPAEIVGQFDEKKAAIAQKWKKPKYIAYFQAGSNTYAPLEKLKKIYESVLGIDGLVGMSIATRPDCINEEIAKYLFELGHKTDLTVELGFQSCHDKTAELINRGYRLNVFEGAYKLLAKYKIPTVVHIINSLPGETPEMMVETARYLAGLDPLPFGLKIHMLYAEPKTKLFEMHEAGQAAFLTREEYVNIVVAQLEALPPQIVIMRLTGDPELNYIDNMDNMEEPVPAWVKKKFSVINDIDKLLEKNGTYQGRLSGIEAGPQKTLTNILSAAKRFFDISIKENGIYADFTMGKGNDTLYIKKACPSGTVYAFDIQEEALQATKKRLEHENCLDEKVHLIRDSHANFKKYLPEGHCLNGAMFNLGYLPGGDKSLTTKTDSTLTCLVGALDMLKLGGVIVVSVYPGHEEGKKEGEKILKFAENLDRSEFDCLVHRLVNIPEAPFVVAFQRKNLL